MTDAEGDEVACHQLGEVLTTKCPRGGNMGCRYQNIVSGKMCNGRNVFRRRII
jgi:hypothetical protein